MENSERQKREREEKIRFQKEEEERAIEAEKELERKRQEKIERENRERLGKFHIILILQVRYLIVLRLRRSCLLNLLQVLIKFSKVSKFPYILYWNFIFLKNLIGTCNINIIRNYIILNLKKYLSHFIIIVFYFSLPLFLISNRRTKEKRSRSKTTY
jgi:hypothetical protein